MVKMDFFGFWGPRVWDGMVPERGRGQSQVIREWLSRVEPRRIEFSTIDYPLAVALA